MRKPKKFLLTTLILLIVSLMLGTNVIATTSSIADMIKPVEYTEEFKRWMELPEEERSKVLMPRMYDIPNTKAKTKNILKSALMVKSSNESRFTLQNVIPNNLIIKNQMSTGSCWAFSTIASLETNLALTGSDKSKVYDFSERHMVYATSRKFLNNKVNENGFNKQATDAGSYFIAETYLTNGLGAIDEAEMPFENNEDIIDISQIQNKTVTSQVYDTVYFPSYKETNDLTQIKEHIKTYGGVFAQIHGAKLMSGYYNNDTGAIYCDDANSCPTNHGVLIIGWDDNYAVENFLEEHRPSKPGAWIIKNSWGTKIEVITLEEAKQELFENSQDICQTMGWTSPEQIPDNLTQESFPEYTLDNGVFYLKVGNDGFMYISYEDINVDTAIAGIQKSDNRVNYDNIYQYNNYGTSNAFIIPSTKVYLANIFNRNSSKTEYLTQVSLNAPQTYTCKVYVNPNGSSTAKSDLQQVQLKAGESEIFDAGYHTLEFLNPIKLNSDSFVVVIEIQSSLDDATLIYSESKLSEVSWYDNVKVENEKCKVTFGEFFDKNDWINLSELSTISNGVFSDCDSTIKAFTVSNIEDHSLKNIEITTPPSKTTYYEGDNFDGTGMVVQANFNDGTSITLDSSSYSITNATNLSSTQTSVTITYEGKSVEQPITVQKNEVTELKIKTPPTKTEYKEHENFDKTGMVVEVTYKNGTKQDVTDFAIENGNDLNKEQTYVTVSYKGKTVNQPITVTVAENPTEEPPEEPVEEKTITSISINNKPTKLTYTQNKETLDLTGGSIKVTYSDGGAEIVDLTSNDVKVTGFSNESVGKVTLTVTYQDKTTQFEVEVIKEKVAVSSNFDNVEAKGEVTNIVFDSKDIFNSYATVKVELSNIKRSKENESYEYYWYISANQEESNIQNWVKITEEQTEDDKLIFTINTKDASNLMQLATAENLYLYIKEVAKNGADQAVFISKGIIVEEKEVEQTSGKDDEKPSSGNDVQSEPKDDKDTKTTDTPSTTQDKTDTTVKEGKLPYTGSPITIVFAILVISTFGIIVYRKYKKISKYVK